MGKSGTKKKFIDKKNAVTYSLMARPGAEDDSVGGGGGGSSMDGASGSGPDPHEGAQVWLRTDKNHGVRDMMAEASSFDGTVYDQDAERATETGTMYSGASAYSSMSNVTFIMGPNGPVPRRERLSREKRRELRELGFDPNEGYDYTRHLRLVGEGGGTMFVPTSKDHVKGTKDVLGAKPSAKAEEVVYIREDVEANGVEGAVPIGEKDAAPAKPKEEETWTHERIKAITDEKVYTAKDTTSLNAIVARVTKAPHAGVAAVELREMVEMMEQVELADDAELPSLKEFDDGGLGDLQDDFILQAMMGDEDDDNAVSQSERKFPPIRLRYDDAEVDNELGVLEDIAEEEALEEEEEEIGRGPMWFRGGGPGSDAGTDRDLDEEDWENLEEEVQGRRRDGYGAESRDVDDAFEAMADQYDSDEIGELDEDDPRIFGHAEIDRFGHVMDEWRKEHGTEQYRSAADIVYGGGDGGEDLREGEYDEDEDEDEDDKFYREYGVRRSEMPKLTEEDKNDARGAMIAIRKRAGLPLPEHLMKDMRIGDSGVAQDDIARRYENVEEGNDEEIEYLVVEKKRDNWDCETIVSTYSNLENHPSLIDEPHAAGRKKKKGKRGGGGDADEDDGTGAAVIRLSATNGLPVDYVQSRRGRGRGGSMLTAANLASLAEGEEEGEDGEWEEGEDGEWDEMETGEEWRQNIRRKGETPEEKKARKAAVKAGRRDARAAKKGLKTTFKQEEGAMRKKKMVGDVRPGLSVTPLG